MGLLVGDLAVGIASVGIHMKAMKLIVRHAALGGPHRIDRTAKTRLALHALKLMSWNAQTLVSESLNNAYLSLQ